MLGPQDIPVEDCTEPVCAIAFGHEKKALTNLINEVAETICNGADEQRFRQELRVAADGEPGQRALAQRLAVSQMRKEKSSRRLSDG